VVGSLDTHDPLTRMLTRESGCRLVSVDYRLAPEAPFPAAVDDAFAAVEWAAATFGQDPLIVAGDSAGANLAAVCAIRARDRGGPRLAMQVLLNPVVDCDFSTDSYVENGDDPLLSAEDMRWYWGHYVPAELLRSHPDASPLRATDHSRLPPAFVVTSAHDVLADEGRAYASRLAAAGVPVTHHEYDDEVHDFVMLVNFLPSADTAVRNLAAAIRRCLKDERWPGT
jgi:acetyl esterase